MEPHIEQEQSDSVVVVVGLGNPGEQYEDTRHNVGFQVLDLLARTHAITFWERKFESHWGTGLIGGRHILLCKPLTFMNRSGEAVVEFLEFFDLPPDGMLVVHDDLDLACGRIRVARRGGAGGHRGVGSIIRTLGHQEFARVKLGIGRPLFGEAIEEFVLDRPYADQRSVFADMVSRGAEAVEAAVALGVTEAMNRFNRRDLSEGETTTFPG